MLAKCFCGASALAAIAGLPCMLAAQEPPKGEPPEFRPFAEVSKDFEKVVSTTDGEASLYTVWKREKDGQMLAELPRGWQNQKHFFAMTVPTGETFAGLQAQDMYVYWKRFDKRMALVMPNLDVRSTGDQESKDSIRNHFVDRVIVDVPIECMGPSGQPVIDLDNLLINNAGVFYGGQAAGINPRLVQLGPVKAFPENVEITFTVPARGGELKTYHYSISLIKDDPEYKPRVADERVGYFVTTYRDLGKFRDDQVETRYINRWKLEKADPDLKLSPPKKPLVYYIEHTVPVRYRRWVKEGVLYWNKAYERVGIKDAIEVYYQDKATGAHMEKDPEDVRYNFIRWLANDIGTAIGPSRAHPLTGQILDADIVLTDGWIRHFWYQANELAPNIAMEGFTPETLAWLDNHPQWDPRVRLASPEKREQVFAHRMAEAARRGVVGYGGMPVLATDAAVNNNPELRSFAESINAKAGLCMASEGMARDMEVMGLYLDVAGLLSDPPADKKEGKKDESDKIDGVPEWFIGPALAHLTVHEVGHTLGLRHNFKASSEYTMAQINSEAMKGKPIVGSVMDYTPVNINMDENAVQGDYHMIGIGDYDLWAIEYGYTTGDLKEVLKRVSEPGLAYATDEDTGGPDPFARRYDFAADPINYSRGLVKLANFSRGRILDKFVKDGEPWSKARRGYEITLNTQMNAVSIMAPWVGGSLVIRDRKGDPGNRTPITPVDPQAQRDALKFCIDSMFFDEAFGLSPELLARMTINKNESPGTDPTWPVSDRIAGMQSATMTMLMNPTRLRRVFDNESFTPRDQDALTLPEVLDTISTATWRELDRAGSEKFSARKPMISTLRQGLQREFADRLIDLTISDPTSPAESAIANLARMKLREIESRIGKVLEKNDATIDPYSKAHLSEIRGRISKALDIGYVRNAGSDMDSFLRMPFHGIVAPQTAPPSNVPGTAPESR